MIEINKDETYRVLGLDFGLNSCGYALMDVNSRYALNAYEFGGLHQFWQSFRCLNIFLIKPEVKAENKSKLKVEAFSHRCASVYSQLQNLKKIHKPHSTFAELATGSRDARSAWFVGGGAATWGALCVNTGGPYDLIVSPQAVKNITGNGKADKKYMIDWAKGLYPKMAWSNNLSDEHMADAIAVTMAGYWIHIGRVFDGKLKK